MVTHLKKMNWKSICKMIKQVLKYFYIYLVGEARTICGNQFFPSLHHMGCED